MPQMQQHSGVLPKKPFKSFAPGIGSCLRFPGTSPIKRPEAAGLSRRGRRLVWAADSAQSNVRRRLSPKMICERRTGKSASPVCAVWFNAPMAQERSMEPWFRWQPWPSKRCAPSARNANCTYRGTADSRSPGQRGPAVCHTGFRPRARTCLRRVSY